MKTPPRARLLWMVLLAGCWRADLATLGGEVIPYTPAAGGPDAWQVRPVEIPGLICPDDRPSRAYLVHPEGEAGPLPVAVMFHDGAFDYVIEPDAADPLGGEHLREPSRLDRDWALRKAFGTVGMGNDPDPFVDDAGALAAALTELGVALVVPLNCWGDLWHNAPASAPNAASAEGFDRRGLEMADVVWRLVANPAFASASGVTWPFAIDGDSLFMVGVGEGGRAVGELLAAGHVPAALAVDSTADDLGAYYRGDPDLYGDVVTGLERLFPGGEPTLAAGSLATAPTLPARTAYVYSSRDPRIPVDSHDAAITRLATAPGGWVVDTGELVHVATASDPVLGTEVAAFLLGVEPETGDTADTGR